MIIFGWRGVTSTANKGTFTCPSCGKSDYALKRVRNFFTLYFIPVIPLNVIGEYVECSQCQDTYNERILDWDPEGDTDRFEAEFQVAMKRVMMKMALADGAVDESETAAIANVFSNLTGCAIDANDIAAEIEGTRDDAQSVEDYVAGVRGQLNDVGKENVLAAAVHIAMADGDFAAEERDLVERLGRALDMSKAHIRGVIAEHGRAAA